MILPENKMIQKTPALINPISYMETTPIVWEGRAHLMLCVRPVRGGQREEYQLMLFDLERGQSIAEFGEGFGLGCAFVENNRLYCYASKWEPQEEWTDIYLLESDGLQHWEVSLAIPREDGERLFNSSVCKDAHGYIMAYESNAYTPFTVKFARSDDLRHWTKLPDCDFSRDRYAACPTIRYVGDYYYVFYLAAAAPGYVTYVARSADLRTWELSPRNPVLTPTPDEGINNSDLDLIELDGQVHLYYATGDQQTWVGLKRATFDGSLAEFCQYLYPGAS